MAADSEIPGLTRIRVRRAAFALTIALLALLLVGLYRFPHVPLPWTALQIGWCALYALTTLLCVFSRCPRCQHLFHSVYPTDNPFSRSCKGCGLKLGTPGAQ
jgi:hypothetical protein